MEKITNSRWELLRFISRHRVVFWLLCIVCLIILNRLYTNDNPHSVQRELDYDGLDLTGKRLVNTDLHNSTFQKARLNHADLSTSNLLYANFAHTDMRSCRLVKSSLDFAFLYHADLRDANLTEASLWGACLSGADLRGATLKGVQFTRATYDGATRWPVGFDPTKHGLTYDPNRKRTVLIGGNGFR
jgi:uncharacterized protein YjbI with pentapeptide repeats